MFIFFLSAPFIQEAENLGNKSKKFPKILDLIKLKTVRSERWFWMYLIFLGIFSVPVVHSIVSKGFYEADPKLIFKVLAVQAVLWGLVVFRIRK